MVRIAFSVLIVLIIVQLVTSARIIRDAPPTEQPGMTMAPPASALPIDPNALLETIKGLFSPEGLMQIKAQLDGIGAQLQATAQQVHEALQAKVKQLHPNMKK